MKEITLISCCKTKNAEKGLAKDMYTGQFSAKAYQYATKIHSDYVFFLSPEYGLIEPCQEVKKVNKTFNDLKAREKEKWYQDVLNHLENKGIDLEKDRFLFLAPKNYWKGLVKQSKTTKHSIKNYASPLLHKRQGEQIGWITDKVNELEK